MDLFIRGMDGYVSKPIEPAALFTALETVLDASQDEGATSQRRLG